MPVIKKFRLIVSQGEMQKKTITKTKSLKFNDKRFYFSDEITSLPLSHPYLKVLVEFFFKKWGKEKRDIFGMKR